MLNPIVLNDLAEQLRSIRPEINAAIARVLDHGQFIMGPEVFELEEQLKAFTGARHVITCANGTDALQMIMMAKGIGPGDAVICPAFTFTATPESIAITGATPVFCDVLEDTFNIDARSIAGAAETARSRRLTPRAVIAVDLFGQPANYEAVRRAAAEEELWILADAAQSLGATYKDAKVGRHGLATATSFFPAKPLGCYGDGGAILTDDEQLAEVLRSLRVHGKGSDKYDNVRIGLNSRLDTLQAAVLLQKMKVFPQEIRRREEIAARYSDLLSYSSVALPNVVEHATSVWAQYTIRAPEATRSAIRAYLTGSGVDTAVYYPKPLSAQRAYSSYPIATGGIPVSERLPKCVISLPMHPYLSLESQTRVAEAIEGAHQSL